MFLTWGVAIIVLLFGFVVLRGAPYVPSHKKDVKRAFTELYPLSIKDVLVDVGSGDGVILRLAAECGARAIGYELNPILVLISRALSRGNSKIRTQLTDFWLTKLPSDTTVVYAFTVSRDVKKLTYKLQHETNKLGRPLHLIIYGNTVPTHRAVREVSAFRLYTFEPTK
jgi:hypothetical protein